MWLLLVLVVVVIIVIIVVTLSCSFLRDGKVVVGGVVVCKDNKHASQPPKRVVRSTQNARGQDIYIYNR